MPMIMIRHFLHIYTITELTIVMDRDSFQDKAKLFLAQSCQETSKVHKHPAGVNDTTYSQSIVLTSKVLLRKYTSFYFHPLWELKNQIYRYCLFNRKQLLE